MWLARQLTRRCMLDARRCYASFAQPPESPAIHHSTRFLSGAAPLQLALLVLNVDGESLHADSVLSRLWKGAALRMCADGAANRLHDGLPIAMRSQMLPDQIRGDLDSLRPEVAEYYRGLGVRIEYEPEQDTHDFEKCLQWLKREQEGAASAYTVVAFGAFGGRLDHTMANLNMVYRYPCFTSFVLLSADCVGLLLPPGRNVVQVDTAAEDGTCGLIPLGGRCEGVRTSGLQWDLDGQTALEFGGLVSSSNQVTGDEVVVETTAPLLWTSNLRRTPVQ
jgi:thiamine pyrophosphokinase